MPRDNHAYVQALYLMLQDRSQTQAMHTEGFLEKSCSQYQLTQLAQTCMFRWR